MKFSKANNLTSNVFNLPSIIKGQSIFLPKESIETKSYVNYRILLFTLVITLFSIRLEAQQLIYDHFGIREGLSSRLVTDIIHDRQNLVWVATANGLNRFDGYGFVTFTTNDRKGDGYKLSYAQIKKLSLAKDGRIVIFYQGLYSSFDIIDPLTFQIERIEVLLNVKGHPRALHTTKNGDIYALSKTNHTTSISIYNFEKKEFNQISQISEKWKSQHPRQVNFLPTASGNHLIYDAEMGLRAIDTSNTVHYFPEHLIDSSYTKNTSSLSFLHQARDGEIWMSYLNKPGVFNFDEKNFQLNLSTALPNEKKYTNIWEDEEGNLIFNEAQILGNYPLSDQLLCLQDGKNVINFSHLLGAGQYILSVSGHDFLQSILIGTDTGLKVVQNSTTIIEQYLAQNIGEDKRGYSMRGMCTDGKGTVYIAREVDCWYQLDIATKILDTIFLYDEKNQQINFTRAQGIMYDSTGFVWGLSGDGSANNIGLLHCYDIENCTNTVYSYKEIFTAYAQGTEGQIWLGAKRFDDSGSLIYFDKTTKTFSQFLNYEGQNPFSNTHIRYILADENSTLWIGTEQGLFWVDVVNKKCVQYMKGSHHAFPKAKRVNISDNTIYTLFRCSRGLLWIGTLNGLSSFNTKTEEWETFYKEDGLASNTIAHILPGKGNTLWISTYNGLTYFTPDEDKSRLFFSINGLSHNEFNRFSGTIDVNGRYYFGGVNGVNSFNPTELLVSDSIPSVLLTGFTYFDRNTDSTHTQYSNLSDLKKNIIIEPSISFFSFDLALPIYMPKTNNQFRYKTSKDDKEWIYMKKDHRLHFNNLKAGNYTIQIQGADLTGNWSKESLVINLLAEKVVYRRPWFLILASLLFAGIIYGLLRYRLEEKLRMERLRTQLASDLHDEVSGLLAGISMQSELLRSQVSEENISIKLQNIRQASQRAMSKISDVIWSTDSRRDRIEDLISRMKEHADEVLLPLNIRYRITTHELDPLAAIPADIRQDIYFIYKEAINNVAKHANADKVIIDMNNDGSNFKMVIKDNGKSKIKPATSPPTRKRKGQGLSNLKMRAQRLNAHLDILTNPSYSIHLRMKRFS